MTKIVAPTNCPSCNELLEWENDQLFCYNTSCESKTLKVIEHFSRTLKIKGLGPSTIQKLNITTINQIYEMSLDEMAEALRSVKLATKVLAEIENSKKVNLEKLLPAFSIPLIGNSASAKICAAIPTLYDLNEGACKTANLGPKATESLMNWFNNTFLVEMKYLPFSFKPSKSTPAVEAQGVVCITGKLVSFKNKAEAEKELLAYGYITKSSVTKEVTMVLNESGIESSKTKKARDNSIPVFTHITQILGK